MHIILGPLFAIISIALEIYLWVIIASAVLSWLIAFNVVNTRSPAVAQIGQVLYRLTEPALRPIRKRVPPMGGVDIASVILILVVIFAKMVVSELAFQVLYRL